MPFQKNPRQRCVRWRQVAAGLVIVLLTTACVRNQRRVAPAPNPPAPVIRARSDSAPPADSAVRAARASDPADATLAYLESRQLMVPVEGVRVSDLTDTFNQSRGDRAHNAHDIMARRGTPVLSADDGVIIRLSRNELGGITIYATDPAERLVYYYAHLDRYADGLKPGQQLQKGDVIGYVGYSGNASASAPHLHFQVARMTHISRHWEGVPIDALRYFSEDGRSRR